MALTGKNEIVGTLYYMSPEQLQAQAPARIDAAATSSRSAWCCMKCSPASAPLRASSPADVIASVLKEDPPLIAPAHLNSVIRTCLAKGPDDRWRTAREVRRELLRPEAETTTAAAPRPWLLAPTAVVLALPVGAVGAALFFYRPETPHHVVRFNLEPPAKLQFSLLVTSLLVTGGFSMSTDGGRLVFAAHRPTTFINTDTGEAGEALGASARFAVCFSVTRHRERLCTVLVTRRPQNWLLCRNETPVDRSGRRRSAPKANRRMLPGGSVRLGVAKA